jgi:hypothetical protein
VNDVPSFRERRGPNRRRRLRVRELCLGWATAISPGPSDEAAQTVTFIVTNSNPSFVLGSTRSLVRWNLDLYSGHERNGSATVTVSLRDNGGTANGGVDTSAAQTFTISVPAGADAPVLSVIATQIVNELSTLLVTNTATDADLPTDTLHVLASIQGAPSGATIDPVTGALLVDAE